MAPALPNGFVSHTDGASSELRRFDSVDSEDIAKLWRGRHCYIFVKRSSPLTNICSSQCTRPTKRPSSRTQVDGSRTSSGASGATPRSAPSSVARPSHGCCCIYPRGLASVREAKGAGTGTGTGTGCGEGMYACISFHFSFLRGGYVDGAVLMAIPRAGRRPEHRWSRTHCDVLVSLAEQRRRFEKYFFFFFFFWEAAVAPAANSKETACTLRWK